MPSNPEFREAVGLENLKNLQRIADENADQMKEGTYLELCGLHKSLYKEHNELLESNEKLYTLWQAEKNRVTVPFQARLPPLVDMDTETFVRVNEEWVEHSEAMDALRADLAVANRSLNKLKPIVRITGRVKESAIKNFCKGDPRGVGHGRWTWQNLAQHYESMFWFETEAEHNDFVSSLNERQIYEDYKRMFNERVRRSTREAQMLKMNLEREMKRVERRMALLTMTLDQVDGHPPVAHRVAENVQMR